MSSFDHMEPSMPSPPPHGDMMMSHHPGHLGHTSPGHTEMLMHQAMDRMAHGGSPGHSDLVLHRGYMHSDDMVGSVGSDYSGTPSDMSHSPISH